VGSVAGDRFNLVILIARGREMETLEEEGRDSLFL
jgi:hypothetical protein